jgi:DNA-binding LacI/PurR family transcriptional regulator
MKTRTFRKASIKDVALRAGVSTTTVSYFVNGREDVCAPETAARIRAAIDELQYTPSSLTRGLRSSRATNTIGVCLYSPLDPELRFGAPFFERLWRGIVRESDDANYSLLHYPKEVRDGVTTDAFLDGRVDGLLFHQLDPARGRRVVAAGMPTVLLARSVDLPDGCGAVFADESRTVGLALDHLFTLGHRRIAHLAGPVRPAGEGSAEADGPDDVALLRLAAYTSWMERSGSFDPALIGHADSWVVEGDRVAGVVAEWAALPKPPTAVLCANDALATAVVAAALALGVSVPGELSVVGIDDSAEARQAPVPLTSVAVPVEEIGREGVRALLRLMAGGPADSCRVALPVTDIVVRASTAPPGRPPVRGAGHVLTPPKFL